MFAKKIPTKLHQRSPSTTLFGDASAGARSDLHLDREIITRSFPCHYLEVAPFLADMVHTHNKYILPGVTEFSMARSDDYDPDDPLPIKYAIDLFMFLLANNFLDGYSINQVFDWIIKNVGLDYLMTLFNVGTLYAKILARKTLYAAVKLGDAQLVNKLLQNGALHITPPNTVNELLALGVRHENATLVEVFCKAGAIPEVHGSWLLFSRLWLSENTLVSRMLLLFGADPDSLITNKENGFPLVAAASIGNLDVVSLLLHHGANINLYVPSHHETALQAAIAHGKLDVAKYLVQCGADVNAPQGIAYESALVRSRYGARSVLQTSIQIAAQLDDMRLIQLLIDNGACPIACPASGRIQHIPEAYRERWRANRFDRHYASAEMISTTIQYAAQNQNFDLIRLLLCKGVDPNSRVEPTYGDTALQTSARLGNTIITKLLLLAGADVNAPPATYNGRTALQAAAESGDLEAVQQLLQKGADMNAPAGNQKGMTAIQAAALNGHSFIVGFLCAMGADVNVAPANIDGLTAVQAAAVPGDIDTLKCLIHTGTEVNSQVSKSGKSTLGAAMTHKDLSLVQYLIQKGADLNGPALSGRTALQEAARTRWLEGAEYLLDQGAQINEAPPPFQRFETCVMSLGWAIHNNDKDMISLFLDHGAGTLAPVSSDDRPMTALLYALENECDSEIIGWLLELDPNFSNNINGKEGLKLAMREGNTKSIEMILGKIVGLSSPSMEDQIRNAWHELPSWYDDKELLIQVLEILLQAGADQFQGSLDEKYTLTKDIGLWARF